VRQITITTSVLEQRQHNAPASAVVVANDSWSSSSVTASVVVISTDDLGSLFGFIIVISCQLLSEKWWRLCSSAFGCVKFHISIAIVRATNVCLWGTRMKKPACSVFGMKKACVVFTANTSDSEFSLVCHGWFCPDHFS